MSFEKTDTRHDTNADRTVPTKYISIIHNKCLITIGRKISRKETCLIFSMSLYLFRHDSKQVVKINVNMNNTSPLN